MRMLAVAGVFVWCMGWATPVEAQTPSLAEFESMLRDAQMLRRNAKCPDALRLLERAESILIDLKNADSSYAATIFESRGYCLASMGRPVEAEAALRKAAELYHAYPEPRDRVLDEADRLHRRHYGTLHVTCDAPSGIASIGVEGLDGSTLPEQDCGSIWPDVPIGLYTIVGTAERGIRVQEATDVRPGPEKTIVRLSFPATLEVDGPRGLPVKIDGPVVGEIPLVWEGIPPNKTYDVEIELPGGPAYRRTVRLHPGRWVELKVQDTSEPAAPAPALRPTVVDDSADDSADDLRIMLPWALVAGAVGAGALGGVFLYRGERAEDDAGSALKAYDALCPDPEPLNCGPDQQQQLKVHHRRGDAALEDALTDRTAGWIAIGTSAALLGAATWLLLDTWPASLGVVGIEPADGGASLRLRGTF